MYNRRTQRFDLTREADAFLLNRSVSASVIINSDREIVSFRGDTDLYLTLPSGKASFHILKLARRGLVIGLRTAISRAKKEGHAVKREGLRFQDSERARTATIEVIPLSVLATPSSKHFFLVLFADTSTVNSSLRERREPPELAGDSASSEERPSHLALEYLVPQTKTGLFMETLKASNEELQTLAEDLRVTNEELQSVNEELEISKEELQVTIAELTTTNQELQTRNEQLKAAHDYTNTLVETIWEPVIVLDENLRVVWANKAFYTFFQTTAGTTEQHILAELGNGQWNIPSLCMVLHNILLYNQDLYHFEVDHTFPAIGHKKMLLNARRISWEKNEMPLILLAFEDVTDRELEKQRQQFLGLATHELKTPLTSLKTYTEFLQFTFEQAGDLQSAQLLAKMDGQVEMLIDLTQELLDATQVESGHFRIHRKWVDLREMVRQSVEEMQSTTSHHAIVIESEVTGLIYADRMRIRQVLLNLLSNAIKYSPLAGRILVNMVASPEGTTFSVQDFGQGIAPDQHHNLFERFFRVRSERAETYPGLGLGLYIAAQIIDQHEGRIWVESEEGKGAIFSFFLPPGPEAKVQAPLSPQDTENSMYRY
jgi:two-component system CheB/CheR fusion protein